jgi:hypothetical protein
MFVKEAFTHTYGHGGTVTVPAGARTERADRNFRWVDPSIFPKHTIERHDAEYIGIRVPWSNITEELPE